MGNKTGIYVHIPFCTAKCPYCDFYSLPASDKMHRQYIKTVCDSINREQNVQADTLYFGGGTPSLLEPALLEQVIKTAQEQFSLSGETTIEANPCTVTPQKLVAWKRGSTAFRLGCSPRTLKNSRCWDGGIPPNRWNRRCCGRKRRDLKTCR